MSLNVTHRSLAAVCRADVAGCGGGDGDRCAVQPGGNDVKLLVNNPSDTPLSDAHLFLEFVNISGHGGVAKCPTRYSCRGAQLCEHALRHQQLQPGLAAQQDYIVLAFLTDYQGNILDTAGRPLSSFQADPLPKLAADDGNLDLELWHGGARGLCSDTVGLANTGYGRLYTYLPPATGLSLGNMGSRTVSAADLPSYELTLATADLPIGPYDKTISLRTSDPAHATYAVHVLGAITAPSSDTGIDRCSGHWMCR